MGASLDGVSEPLWQHMRARSSAQPFRTFRQPLRLARPDAEPPRKLAILCSFSSDVIRERIAAGHPRGVLMAGPEWRFVDLPTGHWPMFSRPADLADALDEASRQ
jgi:hypothetical protein